MLAMSLAFPFDLPPLLRTDLDSSSEDELTFNLLILFDTVESDSLPMMKLLLLCVVESSPKCPGDDSELWGNAVWVAFEPFSGDAPGLLPSEPFVSANVTDGMSCGRDPLRRMAERTPCGSAPCVGLLSAESAANSAAA